MATDNFIYQGINRAVSDYSGARACEELINLRPTEGGVVPVRDFATKLADTPYRRIFVHHSTAGDHIIGIRGTVADHVYIEWVRENASAVELVDFALLNQYEVDDVIENTSFAAAGNIILFSTYKTVFENHAFVWKENSYQEMEADAPNVSFSISSVVEVAQTNIPGLGKDTGKDEVVSAVENGLNAIQENNLNLCLGPVIIAVAFKTKDGSTFWTGNWTIYDPIPTINTDNRFYLDTNSSWFLNQVYRDFGYYTKYDHAYSLIPLTDGGSQGGYAVGTLDTITVPGTKVTLTFPAITGWNEDTSIIQSLEVYASRPQVFIDATSAADGFYYNAGIAQAAIIVPQKKYDDMELGGQLLYHQASIPMSTLAGSSQAITLSFGGNIQMSEDTLDTDAGALKRYGRVLSYNARFHFFDSVSQIKVGMPTFNFPSQTGSTATADVLAKYQDDEGEHLICLGELTGFHYTTDLAKSAYLVIAPSLNIKEVIVYAKVGGGCYMQYYRMTESSSYNFSLCTEGAYSATHKISGTISEYDQAIVKASYDGYGAISDRETDAINVTEQYNPFVFLVEHSYKAPGNIIDVLPQMAGVVDTSYGRDPLNVFTERGLYALTQGSANVLYGAFLPLSNLKARRGGLPLEGGIYFLADGGLWLVSGRQVFLVSEALNLGPHKYVRDCTGYKKLCGTDTDYSPIPAPANPYYDVSPFLSKVEFKDFANGGRLAYNRFRMEIFVSNQNYEYSYVLALKYKQWFKVSKRLWQDDMGSYLINTPGTIVGKMSVLDVSSEVTVSTAPLLIHLQSRPFSMGYQYSHVHRIVAMVRAMLASANNRLAAGLYGSDDLQHWKLLAYAKRSGKTEWNETTEQYDDTPLFLSQVRTTSSARSWRYYTICLGGVIPVDADFPTDIGPIIVDYQPVIRRIG